MKHGEVVEIVAYTDTRGNIYRHRETAITESIRDLIMDTPFAGVDRTWVIKDGHVFSNTKLKKNREKIIDLLEQLGECE